MPEANTEKEYSKFEEQTELVTRIHGHLKDGKRHLDKWRKQAIIAFDYFAGNQWSTEDKAKLDDEQRPAIVFNRTVRVINAVAGLELQNRQEVVYKPRELNDSINNELLTNAARWVRDLCDAEDEESQAFKDDLICGIGWLETHIDYEQDPDGMIFIERTDPLEMLYDPAAKKRNLDDARWVARIKEYDKHEFKEIWPDAEISQDESSLNFWGSAGQQPINVEESRFYRADSGQQYEIDKNSVQVIQYQWFEREPFYRVEHPQDGVKQFSVEEFNKIKEYVEANGFKYVKQYKRQYKQAFLLGKEILEQGDCAVNMFTFRAITGLLDRNNNTWFGLMQLMIDPQMYANKWLSQILYILNSNAKGGLLYESGAFADPRAAAEDMARPDKNVELVSGGLEMIRDKPQIQYPAGIDKLLNYAIESINELVGVNLEMLGVSNRDQAAVLEMQRKQAGITVLADFFDALRRYRKEQGRVLADFILEYISDGRLIKVVGGDLGKHVPLMKEHMDVKYDVEVDEAPSSPNMKDKVFMTISSLLPQLLEAGIPIPPEILDYAPLPTTLIEKWKQQIADQGPDEYEQFAQEVKKRLAELEVERNQADIKNTEAKTQETQAKTEKTGSEIMVNYAKAEHEAKLADIEPNAKLREQNRKDVELAIDALKN